MARPRTHDEALRQRLLVCAGELLAEEGAKALSLRKLAADAGTSTTAVYSLFGGKPDLVNALYTEGFRRFGARIRAVPGTGDAVEDVVQLGLAYRQSALADPNLYAVMFTKAVPGFEPSAEANELGRAALSPLVDTVRDGISRGQFRKVAPETIAVSCWGVAHGMVSLELNGNLPLKVEVGAAYEQALRAQVRGWQA
ncbi:TetR/AcrR family transcriptional regulator [Amycolatopsis pithecellobii]|uniref:TetR family transcriptional regulator n=1 Tax=Amycolatopsis pithecellobii TaxID=664692 RepID=A0A6N7ZC98_9PSEU|nr:TetR/AcrR family transcriptional regulator [Amycolatopsis pithecellobii]MTD59348.1 TetR family transcriptional regulator [Amycolatopsis pithecellobii]